MKNESGGMTFVEFIGFVISIAAFLFLFLKQLYDDIKKRRDPQGYAEKQRQKERALRELLGEKSQESSDESEYEEEVEEDEESVDTYLQHNKEVPPLPTSYQSSRNAYTIAQRFKLDEEQRKELLATASKGKKPISSIYEVQRKSQTSRGSALINKITSRKDLFIINEIIKPPVSLRSEEENNW